MKTLKFGYLLLEKGLISAEQLKEALRVQSTTASGKKIGEVIVELGFADEVELTKVLAEKLNVGFIDLAEIEINKDIVWTISDELARKYNVIPYAMEGSKILLATNDPMNFSATDEIKLVTGYSMKPVLAAKSAISNAIEEYYSAGGYESSAALEDVNSEFTTDDVELENDEVLDAPIVKFVNSMIQQAIHMGASDIHIEPLGTVTRVRLRVDGELHSESEIKASAHNSIITRIKIIGGMDIAERRIPLDGRVEFKIDNRTVDLRLSSIPTVFGEKMVIRILGNTGLYTMDQLGLSEHNRAMLDDILQTSYGMLLVCGPTGSGKSTTVYAILNQVSNESLNTMTVEDPVEYHIAGINQVQVNNKAGLTFASALRSFLRQDPDIMMVGEIRDGETATIATRAAITGHLVISTIHTNDAASTTSRLVNMGVDPFMVSSSMIGVISQRLVKKLCPKCKEAYTTNEHEMKMLGITEPATIYRKVGCPHCNETGHKGRMAVHEILRVTAEIRQMIDTGAPTDELRKKSIEQGTITLQDGCKQLVLDGEVSVEEMLRATYVIG